MHPRICHALAAVLGVMLNASSALAEIRIEAYYTGEILHNTTGGLDSGSAYLSDAGVMLSSSFDGLFGVNSANVFAYALWNNSTTFSDRYVGDLQVVSNIDAGQAVRLYELWYEEQLLDNLSLRFGLYDLNSEFDVIDSAGLFLNSSHGIGADFGQTGRNGPSIFPVTSLAARLEWPVSKFSLIRYALLDGVPGDPNDVSKTTIELGGDDGVLHAIEYNFQNDGGARLGIGGWLYSADFDLIEATGMDTRDNGNAGIYAFVDAPVYSSADGLVINAFLRYGVADDEFNAFDSYLGAGAVVKGVIGGRPDDEFGVALASAGVGDPYRRISAVGGESVGARETSIELTYSARINSWLRLQPDIQYVIDPAGNPGLGDSLVLGLRFEISADKQWASLAHY